MLINKNYFFFIISSASLWLSACSTTKKIEALKPAPSYSTTVAYDKQTSYINLPVELAIADLQTQTNKYLNGLIYEDNVLEGDNVMLKVWKQAPIVIDEKNGKLYMELPLKIWTKVRYGIEKFGLSAYDTRELNLNGKIKISASVAFKNWKFTTNTQILGIDWVESPSISIAGKSMPITYLLNPALAILKPKLSKMVDDAIAQSVNVKPYVLNALEKVSTPIEVNNTYHVWFGMQPLELYTSDATITNKKVILTMGMKAYLETSVNSKPTLAFDKSKLLMMAADKLPADFTISIAGIATYENAGALMQTNFAGKRFESGSRSVTINRVAIWGKDGKMIVQLNMSGSVNGDFYLAGVPQYDAVKKEIYLDQIDFVLDSKNKLLKIGDWLAHGIIANKIKENCRYSIKEQLTTGEATIKQYLNNYEPIKGVKVSGAVADLGPQKITLTPNAIVTMLVAKGKVGININGMQ